VLFNPVATGSAKRGRFEGRIGLKYNNYGAVAQVISSHIVFKMTNWTTFLFQNHKKCVG
ncbi:uncharacterized protein METZ01_LOCUS217946, partial [marine metagenome]